MAHKRFSLFSLSVSSQHISSLYFLLELQFLLLFSLSNTPQNINTPILHAVIKSTQKINLIDYIITQFPQKFTRGVEHHGVVPEPGAHECLLDARHRAHSPQGAKQGPMVDGEVFAGMGIEALSRGAGALFHLAVAGGPHEVGGGPAHVVNVALKP